MIEERKIQCEGTKRIRPLLCKSWMQNPSADTSGKKVRALYGQTETGIQLFYLTGVDLARLQLPGPDHHPAVSRPAPGLLRGRTLVSHQHPEPALFVIDPGRQPKPPGHVAAAGNGFNSARLAEVLIYELIDYTGTSRRCCPPRYSMPKA